MTSLSPRHGIFITGGSGLLATNWAMGLRDRHAVTLGLHDRQVVLRGVATARCGLDTVDEALHTLDAVEPHLVIHTAGLTNVDACEADPRQARHVNVDLAANVAVACERRRVPLVHISTDHLFRGDEALVGEQHPPAPQNVYGQTKAVAEQRVLDAHAGAIVVRTNFYGWGTNYRRSFSDTIINSLRHGEPVTLFADVFYTPILADVARQAVLDLSAAGAHGIFHVVGDERVSKHAFGLKVAEHFGLDAGLIRLGSVAEAPALAYRPRDMSLSNAKACGLLGRTLGVVNDHLALLRQEEQRGLAQELRNL